MKKIFETTAYHASPFNFDKFDVKFLGKGEGSQAHGYGLYFALTQETGQNYYNKFKDNKESPKQISYNGKAYKVNSLQGLLLKNLLNGKERFFQAIKEILSDEEWINKHKKVLPKLKKLLIIAQNVDEKRIKYHQDKIKIMKGQYYTVELPQLDQFIQEGKPLEKQSAYVQNALKNITLPYSWNNRPYEHTAKELYQYGIKGVKYNGGKDGRCVVVFNGDDVKISNKDFNYTNDRAITPSDKLKSYNFVHNDDDIKYSDIKNPSEEAITKDEILKNPNLIKTIKNPSEELQIALIKNYPGMIGYIENPCEEAQLISANRFPQVLKYIKNPTEKTQRKALQYDGKNIQYIKNPSEELQLLAVKQNGGSIKYIANPSTKVQMEAIKKNGEAIKYIENPTEKMQLMAVRQPQSYALAYIKNPSFMIQNEAVKHNGVSIRFIKNPSEELQLLAVTDTTVALKYIENPTEKTILAAIKKDAYSLTYVSSSLSKNLKCKIVEVNPHCIYYMKNPPEEAQIIAVRSNPKNIGYIKKPTPKVIELANQLKS